MTKLSVEAIERLRAVQQQILAEPEMYDQGQFVGSFTNPCNTACCIAGWLDWNESREQFQADAEAYRDDLICDRAKVLLGVDERMGLNLFARAAHWPEPFCNDYSAAHTDFERARVAVARIDHFIMMDGAE